jgi:hypothetical protein
MCTQSDYSSHQGLEVRIVPKKKHDERILMDELYCFLHHKGKKLWVFYACAPETKEILAFTMDKRIIRQVRYLFFRFEG